MPTLGFAFGRRVSERNESLVGYVEHAMPEAVAITTVPTISPLFGMWAICRTFVHLNVMPSRQRKMGNHLPVLAFFIHHV